MEKLFARLSTYGLPIGAALVSAIFWFAHVEGAQADLVTRVVELKAGQADITHRVDTIEESRSIGLQRLAKNEEAVSGIQRVLAVIDAKLDRVLMRGR